MFLPKCFSSCHVLLLTAWISIAHIPARPACQAIRGRGGSSSQPVVDGRTSQLPWRWDDERRFEIKTRCRKIKALLLREDMKTSEPLRHFDRCIKNCKYLGGLRAASSRPSALFQAGQPQNPHSCVPSWRLNGDTHPRSTPLIHFQPTASPDLSEHRPSPPEPQKDPC